MGRGPRAEEGLSGIYQPQELVAAVFGRGVESWLRARVVEAGDVAEADVHGRTERADGEESVGGAVVPEVDVAESAKHAPFVESALSGVAGALLTQRGEFFADGFPYGRVGGGEPVEDVRAKCERCMEQRGGDALTLTGEVAVAQSGNHAERGEHTRAGIGEGRPDVDRGFAGGAVANRAEARHPLDHDVVAAIAGKRAVIAERNVFEVDHRGVDFGAVFIGEAVARDVGRLHRDQHDVSGGDEAVSGPAAGGVGEVEADGALAAVEDCETFALAGDDGGLRVAEGVARGWFELDDLGAHI